MQHAVLFDFLTLEFQNTFKIYSKKKCLEEPGE